jgi:hypothetical protein
MSLRPPLLAVCVSGSLVGCSAPQGQGGSEDASPPDYSELPSSVASTEFEMRPRPTDSASK